MKYTIGGNVSVKNCIEFDYCIKQCVDSLLPVCDVVNIVDSDSTDGSVEMLKEMAEENPKIQLLNYPWPNPVGDRDCLFTKLNWSRERLPAHYHLLLEADEVLAEESYEYIRGIADSKGDAVLGMHRHNFWEDPQHELAPGFILSPHVIRFAPQAYWMGGDASHPLATQTEPNADWSALEHCHIYHYGFLRHPESFLKKWRVLMLAFNGSDNADPAFPVNFAASKSNGTNWMKDYKLGTVPFDRPHPIAMHDWLRERGYGKYGPVAD